MPLSTPSAEDKRSVEDKRYDDVCLPLFRSRNYVEAASACLALDWAMMSVKRLAARYTLAASLRQAVVDAPGAIGDAHRHFVENMDAYLPDLAGSAKAEISPTPILDFFAAALADILANADAADISQSASVLYDRFLDATKPKMNRSDFLGVLLRAAGDERANYARPDHADRAAALANVLHGKAAEEPPYQQFMVDAHLLLADLACFFPSESRNDTECHKDALSHLDAALLLLPGHAQARRLREHVLRIGTTTLQISRFQHDTNSRVGNMTSLMQKLKKTCSTCASAVDGIASLDREVQSLRVLTKLVRGEKPDTSDWHETDVCDTIAATLATHNLPFDCVITDGQPLKWEFAPALFALALDNLLRNAMEAYERSGIVKPHHPVSIAIHYTRHIIELRDWAGGIPSGLGDVFEPYISSKGVFSNVGLGLAQARQAMAVQGFSLFLTDSQPHGGAAFTIDFNHGK